MEIIKNIEEEQVLFIVNFLDEDPPEEVKEIKTEKLNFVINPTCYFCNNSFKNQSELALHRKISPGCDVLKVKRPIERPGRVKTYNKNHTCEVCRKQCPTVSALTFHMQCHQDQRGKNLQSFVCKVCNKSILGAESMKRHKRRHQEVKSYKCELCPRAFNCASLLAVHLRVHTGERPFSCKFCDRMFSAKSNCVAHEMRHSGRAKKFVCPFPDCNKEFQQKTGLAYHVSKSHDEDYVLA